MSDSDFTLAKVQEQFKIRTDGSADLFGHVAPVILRPALLEMLTTLGPLALMSNSEKARSELLIAPIIAEVWYLSKRQISVFSGIEFNVEAEVGLNGVCDFLIARSPNHPILQAPVLAVVAAP